MKSNRNSATSTRNLSIFRSGLSSILFLLLYGAVASAATTVDTCGQLVGGVGKLTADLDCAAFVGDAVTLKNGAALDLAGFTLTGGTGNGVLCQGGCRVFSSALAKGIIQNATLSGVRSQPILDQNHTVRVKNIVSDGNGLSGVSVSSTGFSGQLIMLDSESTNNGGAGASSPKKVTIKRSVLSGNGIGVATSIVGIADSIVDGNAVFGVTAALGLKAKRTQANGNGTSGFVVARDDGNVRFKDCVADNNVIDGIFFERGELFSMKIVGGSFSDNGRDGIHFDDGRFIGEVNVRVVRTVMNRNAANGLFVGPDEPLDSLRLIKTTSNDNGAAGVTSSAFARGLSARSVTSTGNATFGLRNLGRSATPAVPCPTSIGGSTISGNGTDTECGVSIACADVAACELPELSGIVVCETSYDTTSGFPGSSWNVCSAD